MHCSELGARGQMCGWIAASLNALYLRACVAPRRTIVGV